MVSQTRQDGLGMHACQTRPFGNRQPRPVSRQVMIISSVRVLLSMRRPLHVTRFIMACVLDSINRIHRSLPSAALRTRTHGLKEFLKRVSPRLMHANTPTSIRGISLALRVQAAIFDRRPCGIFASPFAASLSMCAVINLTAFARLRRSTLQIIGADSSNLSALAFTQTRSPRWIMRFNNGPRIELRSYWNIDSLSYLRPHG